MKDQIIIWLFNHSLLSDDLIDVAEKIQHFAVFPWPLNS